MDVPLAVAVGFPVGCADAEETAVTLDVEDALLDVNDAFEDAVVLDTAFEELLAEALGPNPKHSSGKA